MKIFVIDAYVDTGNGKSFPMVPKGDQRCYAVFANQAGLGFRLLFLVLQFSDVG